MPVGVIFSLLLSGPRSFSGRPFPGPRRLGCGQLRGSARIGLRNTNPAPVPAQAGAVQRGAGGRGTAGDPICAAEALAPYPQREGRRPAEKGASGIPSPSLDLHQSLARGGNSPAPPPPCARPTRPSANSGPGLSRSRGQRAGRVPALDQSGAAAQSSRPILASPCQVGWTPR